MREDCEDPRIKAAEEFAKAHDPDPEHAFQVRDVSLWLFDATRGLHHMGAHERFVLNAAALMHDTGYDNNPLKHHKGSRDLILASGLDGFSKQELMMAACVARYHRKADPQPAHAVYGDLEAAEQAIVERLAALVRIADGLDRCHMASAKAVRTERDGGTLYVHVKQRPHNATDVWGAKRKTPLFEKVFKLKIEIVVE